MDKECHSSQPDGWHSHFDTDTLARRYIRSPVIHCLTGVGILVAGLAGLLAAVHTGSEWWIMVAALPAVPFHIGYLWYRREDARNRITALGMAAEQEGWCQCIGCSVQRLGALAGHDWMECWSSNSGVDDIMRNTAAGRRFRAVDAQFASRAHGQCGHAACE